MNASARIETEAEARSSSAEARSDVTTQPFSALASESLRLPSRFLLTHSLENFFNPSSSCRPGPPFQPTHYDNPQSARPTRARAPSPKRAANTNQPETPRRSNCHEVLSHGPPAAGPKRRGGPPGLIPTRTRGPRPAGRVAEKMDGNKTIVGDRLDSERGRSNCGPA